MKRKITIILTFILVLSLAIGLTACKKKAESNDITKNISYAETHRYVGCNDNYKVAVTCGIREKTFVIDGKATDVQNFYEITLIPLKTQKTTETYSYTLYYEGGEVSSELSRDVVTHNYKSQIDIESYKDKIQKIVIKCGETEEEITLENALNGKLTYDKVLEIASNELKDEIGANTTDGILNREILIKLVRDRRSVDSPYYWYVSFIAEDSSYWALLINPETGDIISVKR